MKNGKLKAMSSLRKDDRPHEASVLTFNLPKLIEKVRHKNIWASMEIKK